MPASTLTARARSAPRSSMVVRARAMATASQWVRGRYSSRIITRATSVGRSTNAIRRCSRATPTAGVGDTKSGRGGRALLAGLICCARCGRRLSVLYTGRYPRPIYRCEQPNVPLGQLRCLSVAGKRIDETIAAEMLRAVAPMAIEAAEEAERMLRDEDQDRRRIAELELQQAQYDASLADRRYAACDPDNRLIAAQLEKAWETALERVEHCRKRLDLMRTAGAEDVRPDFTGLAD